MKSIFLITCLAACFTSIGHSETLRDQLQACQDAGAKKLPDSIKAHFAEGITAVKEAKIVEGAKKVGNLAPDFTLNNALEKKVSLKDQLKNGPVVLTWYRGGWCPYCNIALAAMQKELPAIKKAGASLLALSPELPNKALTTKEKNSLEFEVLTDLNHQVAKEYGLIFKLTPEVEKIYGKFFNLKNYNGEDASSNTLPLAATYIIDQQGKIAWSFLHHDYRMRAEPKDIVSALEKLQKDQMGK